MASLDVEFIDVPKHSFIAWLTAQNKVKMRSKLAIAGICVDISCALCCLGIDNYHHLFQMQFW